MRQSRRTARLSDLLLQEISQILHRIVQDPRIQGVTLTQVRVSSDLRHARVYYSVIGEPERERTAGEGLESAKGLIRREIGRSLQLRFIPEITFFFDDTLQYADHIQRLLKKIEPPAS